MGEQVVHLRKMENTEVEAVVTEGPVEEAAWDLIRGIESHGHQWRMGAIHSWDGEATRMEFEVDVTLAPDRYNSEPRTFTWFHVVMRQADPYTRLPKPTSTEPSAEGAME